jgi:hypothetical protein
VQDAQRDGRERRKRTRYRDASEANGCDTQRVQTERRRTGRLIRVLFTGKAQTPHAGSSHGSALTCASGLDSYAVCSRFVQLMPSTVKISAAGGGTVLMEEGRIVGVEPMGYG